MRKEARPKILLLQTVAVMERAPNCFCRGRDRSVLELVRFAALTATTDPRDMKSMHFVLCQFWNAVVMKYQNSQAYTKTGILSNRLIELNLTKQLTRSISRSLKSLRVHTRVRHMATRTGICVSACVRACGVVHLSCEQGDTHRSAGECQCPTTTCPQTAMDLEAFLCTHLSVPLSTNSLGTTPRLRKKAQLCSKRSVERSQHTNSGFWPAENKKKRATHGRLANKSHFERNVHGLYVDKATAAANGKHMRRQLRAKRDPQ